MKWTIAILQALASRRFFKIIPALIICLLVAACSGVVAETDLQSGPFNAPGDKGGQRDAIGGSESDSSGDSGSDKSLDNTSGNGIALGGDSGDGNTSRERALPAASGLNSKPSAPGEKGASVTGASGGSGENGAGDLGDSSLKGAKKKAAEGTGVLGEPRELSDLKGLSAMDGEASYEKGEIRDRAQKDEAYRLSIQTGAIWRYRQILASAVEPVEAQLDETFNFAAISLSQGEPILLAPIVTEAGPSIRILDGDKVRSQEKSFYLVKKAQLASVVPNWRNYLYEDLEDPIAIHPSILPKGASERALWSQRVEKGFNEGVRQAEELFKNNLASLIRDFVGTLLYLELAEGDLIYPPKLEVSGKSKLITDRELIYLIRDYDLLSPGGFVEGQEKGLRP